ncbi:hypothetical protein LCGC14_2363250, partial [marine sediment metagenome]
IGLGIRMPAPHKHLNLQVVGQPGIRKLRMIRNKKNKLAEYNRRINGR